MIREIKAQDLRRMNGKEGLILQGCGGSLDAGFERELRFRVFKLSHYRGGACRAVVYDLYNRLRHRHGAVKGRFNQYDNGFSAYARADSAVQKADCQNAPQAAYAPDQTLVGFFLFAAKGHFPCIGRRDSGLRGAQHRLQYLQLQSKSRFRRAGGAGD